jgi:hypothetical protein
VNAKHRKDRNTIEIQSAEYMPAGPARLNKHLPRPRSEPPPPPKVTAAVTPQPRRFPFGVEVEDRVPGFIYDADSGVLAGSASQEVKAKRTPGIPWEELSGGCKRRLVLTASAVKGDEDIPRVPADGRRCPEHGLPLYPKSGRCAECPKVPA